MFKFLKSILALVKQKPAERCVRPCVREFVLGKHTKWCHECQGHAHKPVHHHTNEKHTGPAQQTHKQPRMCNMETQESSSAHLPISCNLLTFQLQHP